MAKVTFETYEKLIYVVKSNPKGDFDVPEATLQRWEAARTAFDTAQSEIAQLEDEMDAARARTRRAREEAESEAIAQACFAHPAFRV